VRPGRLLVRFALAAAPLAAASCQSQWYKVDFDIDKVVTNVVVRTEPSGAMVYLDSKRMDTAPVRIPIAYSHEVSLWERSTNAGASIRESTGTLGTILLFPIWLPASFFHYAEEMKRHEYGGNVHRITAHTDAGDEAEEKIVLQGEADVTVTLRLGAAKP
jgi:hypothetical protein